MSAAPQPCSALNSVSLGISHQELFSRGIVFHKCLIAALLQRNRRSHFEIMEVAVPSILIGEMA
jgi:hypothetical protein